MPQKPKPAKINPTLVQSWGFKDTNDLSIIRVLKAVGLVGQAGEATSDYVTFMHKGNGPRHLAQLIRRVYEPIFEASHEPHKEPNSTLENLFNIHSGGTTIALQIQTFKSLCDHADFTSAPDASTTGQPGINTGVTTASGSSKAGNGGVPTIHIDLHIHLPGNKSRRDYEYMFEDIAKYIYGRPAYNGNETSSE